MCEDVDVILEESPDSKPDNGENDDTENTQIQLATTLHQPASSPAAAAAAAADDDVVDNDVVVYVKEGRAAVETVSVIYHCIFSCCD